jgi:hypothetical protein
VYQNNTEVLDSIQEGEFHNQLSDCHFIAKDSLRNHWLWVTLKDKCKVNINYVKFGRKF